MVHPWHQILSLSLSFPLFLFYSFCVKKIIKRDCVKDMYADDGYDVGLYTYSQIATFVYIIVLKLRRL
jgi:hypothetical protein